MYRIKLDVDLKELEKYGYKKDTEGNYSKKVMKDSNKAWTYFETIEINKNDRIIRTRLYQDAADQEWYGYIEKTGRFISDLWKDELLEEISELITEKETLEKIIYLNKENERLNDYIQQLKNKNDYELSTQNKMHKKEIDNLQKTIITMSTYCFGTLEKWTNLVEDIDKRLQKITSNIK